MERFLALKSTLATHTRPPERLTRRSEDASPLWQATKSRPALACSTRSSWITGASANSEPSSFSAVVPSESALGTRSTVLRLAGKGRNRHVVASREWGHLAPLQICKQDNQSNLIQTATETASLDQRITGASSPVPRSGFVFSTSVRDSCNCVTCLQQRCKLQLQTTVGNSQLYG